jgi:hypothetical protein
MGLIVSAAALLGTWSIVKYWYCVYALITRTGSELLRQITGCICVFMSAASVLMGLPIAIARVARVLYPSNAEYVGLTRMPVHFGVAARTLAEVLVSTSLFISVAAAPFLGLAALWVKRNAVRSYCVNFCRRRGTTHYPRVPL